MGTKPSIVRTSRCLQAQCRGRGALALVLSVCLCGPLAAQPAAGTTPIGAAPAGGTPTPQTIVGKPVVGQIVAKAGQVIENVHVTTSGGPCIIVKGVSNVTIRNSEIGPCGTEGDDHTHGVLITEASNVTIQRNVIHDVSTGVYVFQSRHPIVLDRNYAYNIRGPMPRGQLIQMNGVSGGTAGSRITCNVSDARPGMRHGVMHSKPAQGVEDHINLYASPGLPNDRTEIAFNRLRGGHKVSTSGSGIMMGDGDGGNVNAHHNVIVDVANAGGGIAGGSNISFDNNVIYMNRANGVYVNIGLYVWAQAGASCSGGHTVRDNRIWVMNSKGEQNPFWNAGNCGAVTMSGNTMGDASLTPAIFDEVPRACQ